MSLCCVHTVNIFVHQLVHKYILQDLFALVPCHGMPVARNATVSRKKYNYINLCICIFYAQITGHILDFLYDILPLIYIWYIACICTS
jgi:hypothetical protein